tara:strand:- start:151 stop:543 length:393 start_codon:yes stop_codon:yes gene_type:complete
MKEPYEITSAYLKDLKKLIDSKSSEISKYDIAHASFRKNNAHWIIKYKDAKTLKIQYLNGKERIFSTYNEFIKRVNMSNEDYKPQRRKYITRYYKIVNAFTKHRAKFKKTYKSIANRLNPEQIKALASQI